MTQEDTLSSKGAVFPPWDLATWRAVDDRVRGGSSQSHLDPIYGHSKMGVPDALLGSNNDEKDGRGREGSEVVVGARFWGNLGRWAIYSRTFLSFLSQSPAASIDSISIPGSSMQPPQPMLTDR